MHSSIWTSYSPLLTMLCHQAQADAEPGVRSWGAEKSSENALEKDSVLLLKHGKSPRLMLKQHIFVMMALLQFQLNILFWVLLDQQAMIWYRHHRIELDVYHACTTHTSDSSKKKNHTSDLHAHVRSLPPWRPWASSSDDPVTCCAPPLLLLIAPLGHTSAPS